MPKGESRDLTIYEEGKAAKIVTHNMKIAQLPKIDTNNAEAVQKRVWEYFNLCSESDMRPTVPGLALSLGIDRTNLWRWANGMVKSKPPEVVEILKQAYAFLNAFLEDAGMSGNVNPAAFIFAAKNHFGYKDQTDIVVAPEQKAEISEDALIAEAKLLDD